MARFRNESLTVVAFAIATAAFEVTAQSSHELYGKTKGEAIEVCAPQGQRDYLGKLLCRDASKPSISRAGSFGPRNPYPDGMSQEQMMQITINGLNGEALKPGETDHHTVDGYNLTCGEEKFTLYLDMYHCGQAAPSKAPEGFKFNKS